MIGPLTVFTKVAHQVSCQINDEVAILDLERSLYFGLEGAGVQIWDALEQPRSVSELCDVLVAEFDVPRADCQADITQILSSLKEEGLVEIAE
jgi:Coenzyme PQQ synthesis protein D (PqqD)